MSRVSRLDLRMGEREPESVCLCLLEKPSSGRIKECFPFQPQITLHSALASGMPIDLGAVPCDCLMPLGQDSPPPLRSVPKSLSLALDGSGGWSWQVHRAEGQDLDAQPERLCVLGLGDQDPSGG